MKPFHLVINFSVSVSVSAEMQELVLSFVPPQSLPLRAGGWGGVGVGAGGGVVGTAAGMWREAAALLTGVSEDQLGILTGRMESSQRSSLPDDTFGRHAPVARCHFLQHLRCHSVSCWDLLLFFLYRQQHAKSSVST